MAVCEKCPLLIIKWYGRVCNDKLWINQNTGETSLENKQDYIRGCGCRLDAKTRDLNSKCPMNKW